MKNLIVYTTRYGFTEKCVQILGDHLDGETEVLCLDGKRPSVSPDWSQISRVILGGSIYAGSTQKPLIHFAQTHLSALKSKTLGLFVCSLSAKETALDYLDSMFPQDLLRAARVKSAFGGGITWKKLKFYERWILGIMKIRQDVSNLDHSEIIKMAEELKKT